MESKETKIYLVTNCYNDPNKVYIGKTINSRKANHRMTFGSQIEYYYIDQIRSINKKDWEPLETKWIQHYIGLGYEVLNKKIKGGSGPSFQTQLTKDKISKALKGKSSPKSKFKKGKEHGHFGKSKNQISINKVIKSLTGVKKSKEHIIKMSLNRSKPILQFDLDGNLIREWISATEAANNLKKLKSSITQCCKGKYKTAYGFKWKYKLLN